MKSRKGGLYHVIGGSVGFILLLSLVIVAFPGLLQEYAGVNTNQLQDSTNVSVDVNSNQTGSTEVVGQASDVVAIYTNFESQNPILNAISTFFLVEIAVALIALLWIGG